MNLINKIEARSHKNDLPDVTRTANNIVRAFEDINKLNKTSYKFLCLLSGFIAHYSYYGFVAYYRGNDLKEDFLRSFCVRNKERYIKDSFFADPDRTIGKSTYRNYYANKHDIIKRVLSLI